MRLLFIPRHLNFHLPDNKASYKTFFVNSRVCLRFLGRFKCSWGVPTQTRIVVDDDYLVWEMTPLVWL